MNHCQCDGPGWCATRDREVTGMGHRVCASGNEASIARYFRVGTARPAKTSPAPRRGTLDCAHLGTEIKGPDGKTLTRPCATCKGTVNLKVYACLHPGHAADPTTTDKVCKTCPDWAPKDRPAAPFRSNGRPHVRALPSSRPEPGDALTIFAYLDSWTGYGQIAEHVGRALEAEGIAVAYMALRRDEGYYPLAPFVRERPAPGPTPGPGWFLQVAPPNVTVVAPGRTVLLTMWESSRISAKAVRAVNAAEAVVVPCAHNREAFAASGVTAPIAVVPMGIDPATYFDAGPREADGPVVFGTAGRVAHGGTRKNLDFVARCFAAASPKMPGARLEVKVWPDCRIGIPPHPAIALVKQPMTPAEIAVWYRSLDVYITASHGEGWGLQTHQAMAVGRPVIAVPWSGTVEFWTPECGWPLDYRLGPPAHFYRGQGKWAEPTAESLVARLIEAYGDEAARRAKGRAAAIRAAEFPWARTGRELAGALRAWGVLATGRHAAEEHVCT